MRALASVRLSRTMSFSAQPATVTRNPFPELSSPEAASQPCLVYMDTSARSTPSSSPPGHKHHFADIFSSSPSNNLHSSQSAYELCGSSVALKMDFDIGCYGVENDASSMCSNIRETELNSDVQDSQPDEERVLFYLDDDNYRPLSVNSTTLVCDACRALTEKNLLRDDVNWTVIEYNTELKLERIMEDHEVIRNTQKLWPNPQNYKLLFRKDFRKFEVFKNPANFIPLEMVEMSQLCDMEMYDLMPAGEQYNHILLQHLFKTCKLPEIRGQCYLKEKKSWKKVNILLRPTGLYYSTKGFTKDVKHLVQLSSLADINIHAVLDGERTLSAPLPHTICLKRPQVTDFKDMILLSMDDKSFQCWHVAFRLTKYGSRLRNDYKSAVNNIEKSVVKEATQTTGNTDAHTQRVAMDFSGTRGRVVADPNEALAAATEEASQWRKKITYRKVIPDDPECPRPSFLTNTGHTAHQFTHGLGAGVHMTQPWFHSGIMRQAAVDMIAKHGLIDGVFLVRESNTIQGAFVLSLAHNHKVKHCQIHKYTCDDLSYYSLDGGHTKFTDLIQLVEFYQLNAAGLPTNLTHYVTGLV